MDSIKPIRRQCAALALTVALSTVVLSGCGNSRSQQDQALIDSLQQKVAQLEGENDGLKTKLRSQDATTNFLKVLTTAANTQERRVQQAPLYTPSNNGQANTESNTTTPATQNTATGFVDLTEVAQRPMIEELSRVGIFEENAGKFDPYKTITRGEYVTWLFKAHNAIMPIDKQIHLAPNIEPVFRDLTAEHPSYKYAQALANAGYSIGYEDGTFRADKPLSREEMIGIKVGVDCGKNIEPYRSQMSFVWKFSDSAKVDERFTGFVHQDFYVSGPYGNNIMRAFGKVGTFHPKQAVTRSEAAGTLWQFGQFAHQGGTAALVLSKNQG